MTRLEQQLERDLAHQLEQLRQAKEVFRVVTEIYGRRFPDPTVAEFQARGDYLRQTAIADAQWFQAEAQTSALAIIALRSS